MRSRPLICLGKEGQWTQDKDLHARIGFDRGEDIAPSCAVLAWVEVEGEDDEEGICGEGEAEGDEEGK